MAAPTFPTAADLVGGTGTRSFAAVTTTAGDFLVVQVIAELDTTTASGMTPSATGLTFTSQNDTGTSASNDHTRIFQWTAPDAAGGSRTVTITPADGATRYRARVTVVRGSGGPGTGKAVSRTAQAVSVARQGANSGMFMAVGDWDAGAVGSPVWTPGGTTVASQQQAGAATYIFGRWDDSGATGTASHGISSPTYGTPSIAVLEMLGTAGGATVNGTGLAAFAFTATSAGGRTVLGAAGADLGFVAAAAGTRSVPGQAASPITFVAEAAGVPTVLGQAAAALAFTAGALGVVQTGPGMVVGFAEAGITFTATVSGVRGVLAQASTPLTLAAQASGLATVFGLATTAFAFTATSVGTTGTPGAVVPRPTTGTTTRPATGTITRPNTGIVPRP